MADFFSFLAGLGNDPNRLPQGQNLFIAGAPNAGVSAADWWKGSTNENTVGGLLRKPTGGGMADAGTGKKSATLLDWIMNPYESATEIREGLKESGWTEPDAVGRAVGGVAEDVGGVASEWFARGAIVILGFVFVAVGLAMFGKPVIETVKSAV